MNPVPKIGDRVIYIQSTGTKVNRETPAILVSDRGGLPYRGRRWKIRLDSGAIRYVNPTSLRKAD